MIEGYQKEMNEKKILKKFKRKQIYIPKSPHLQSILKKFLQINPAIDLIQLIN